MEANSWLWSIIILLTYYVYNIRAIDKLTSEMFPSGTRLTNSFGIFFLTSSKVSLRCFSKSSGVKVGTSPEHLPING